MKQQLSLAVAYCTGARYLLLDEPMNALDPATWRSTLHHETLGGARDEYPVVIAYLVQPR
ncbi:MAG: hypothetical protein ACLTKG_07370 [Collinsella intestinalis]